MSGGTVGTKDSSNVDRSVTCLDIKLIMPTVHILLFTLFVMVTVIPYAFSAVIKQLQGVWALEEQSNMCTCDYISFMSVFSGSRSCTGIIYEVVLILGPSFAFL